MKKNKESKISEKSARKFIEDLIAVQKKHPMSKVILNALESLAIQNEK